jgi:YVTN family beta-propeller protein
MDIQSAALNELFVLYPVRIPGWVTPVIPPNPADRADGGIPQALYNDNKDLECQVDPWIEPQLSNWTMAVNDRVDLYVNDNPNPATGKTVAEGEAQKSITLYLPPGRLDHGVNRLHYKVTRPGGNAEKSRDLWVLYHLRTPESLDLIIPPDVIKDGVGPEQAAQGVEFGFTYTNRRNHDRIEFLLGDTTIRFDVPDAPTPITQKLFTDAFQKAGDNPSAVAEFRVYDQLGNMIKSTEKRLGIHLGRLTLPAPTVEGMTGNNFSPTQPKIRVLVPQGPLLPNDKLSVIWKGSTSVPAGSHTSPPQLVSAGLVIEVPPSVLAYSLGQQVTVSYVIERNGVRFPSLPLMLNILALPATALTPPKIVEADANNVLDVMALGTNNATIRALLWTLIEAGQQVWMTLQGKKADGSAHNLTVWNGGSKKVNATWVKQEYWPYTLANSYLKQLGHGSTLTIRFKAALDKSDVEANALVFPDRTYTVRAVAALNLSFTNAPYTVASGGQLGAINLLLRNAAGTPMPNATITLTLPTGFTYSDGGNGARDFTSGAEGVVIVSGVKGAATPGAYTLRAASSGAPEATAVLTVMAHGPVGTIVGLVAPYDAAISPDGTRVYVTSHTNNSVSVINTVNNSVIKTLMVDQGPLGIAVQPDGSRVYVASFKYNSVSVINTVNWVIQPIRNVRLPYGVAVHPNGTRIYVTCQLKSVVEVIDTATNSVTHTIPTVGTPHRVAVHPNGSCAYVTDFSGTSVSVIDTATNRVTKTITVGKNPWGVAVQPNGSHAYVTNFTDNSVSVIDTATNKVIKTIPVGKGPFGVAVQPDGSCVYVTNQTDNSVSVIDTATNSVIQPIPVGRGPLGVAVHLDGRVYVANETDNLVSVFVSN